MNVSSEVSTFPDADPNRFATAEWGRIFEDRILPLALGNKSLTKAILNVYAYKKLGKTVLINTPFSQNCGLSIHFDTAKRYGVHSEVKRIMRTLATHLDLEYPNAYIDIGFPPEIVDIQPFLQAGFKVDLGYTYRLDLQPSEEDLLRGFSPERRKNVRDAANKPLEVTFDADREINLKVIKQTWQRSGLNLDPAVLLSILEQPWAFSVSVADNTQTLATAAIAYDANCAYYIAGGTLKEGASSGAGALVLWEAIKKAKSLGCQKFDFCGSSVPSIEKFFRGFGGELTPYFRIRKNTQLFDILKSTKDKFSLL